MNLLLSLLSKIALMSSELSASTTCIFILHELPMPEEVKKLNKHYEN